MGGAYSAPYLATGPALSHGAVAVVVGYQVAYGLRDDDCHAGSEVDTVADEAATRWVENLTDLERTVG